MKRRILLIFALLMPTQQAPAQQQPELPAAFHGAWCGSEDALQRCPKGGDFFVHLDAFRATSGKFACSLLNVEPAGTEYRAAYRCEDHSLRHFAILAAVKHFEVGFHPAGMFMREAR